MDFKEHKYTKQQQFEIAKDEEASDKEIIELFLTTTLNSVKESILRRKNLPGQLIVRVYSTQKHELKLFLTKNEYIQSHVLHILALDPVHKDMGLKNSTLSKKILHEIAKHPNSGAKVLESIAINRKAMATTIYELINHENATNVIFESVAKNYIREANEYRQKQLKSKKEQLSLFDQNQEEKLDETFNHFNYWTVINCLAVIKQDRTPLNIVLDVYKAAPEGKLKELALSIIKQKSNQQQTG